MSRLLDVLLQRSKEMRAAAPPPAGVIGDMGHDHRSAYDQIYRPVFGKDALRQDKPIYTYNPNKPLPGDTELPPPGFYMGSKLEPNAEFGGYTVPNDKMMLGLSDHLFEPGQEGSLLNTFSHELGHGLDLSRVPSFTPIDTKLPLEELSQARSAMAPRQIYNWGLNSLDLGQSGAVDYTHHLTKQMDEYRKLFMHPFADLSEDNAFNKWFNKPAERTADVFRDYIQSPQMLSGGAPDVHSYIRDRFSVDPYWIGKLDFKSVVPPVAGAGLAGFSQLEQSNGE